MSSEPADQAVSMMLHALETGGKISLNLLERTALLLIKGGSRLRQKKKAPVTGVRSLIDSKADLEVISMTEADFRLFQEEAEEVLTYLPFKNKQTPGLIDVVYKKEHRADLDGCLICMHERSEREKKTAAAEKVSRSSKSPYKESPALRSPTALPRDTPSKKPDLKSLIDQTTAPQNRSVSGRGKRSKDADMPRRARS